MTTSNIYHGGSSCKKGWTGGGGGGVGQYINYGSSEGVSTTTNAAWQNKLLVSFTAVLGVRYKIEGYCEIFAVADEDVEAELTINTVRYAFSHFKNPLYADRWTQWNGCFYVDNTLTGNQDVRINWRSGFGGGNKSIQRARILITRLD